MQYRKSDIFFLHICVTITTIVKNNIEKSDSEKYYPQEYDTLAKAETLRNDRSNFRK